MKVVSKRCLYGILSIVLVLFSIPFNLFEDFLPKFEVMATNQYSSYEKAYRSVLTSTYGLNTSNVRFGLVYIDGNEPELIVAENCSHADGVKIYSYKNGKLVQYFNKDGTDEFGSYGAVHFVESKGYIVSDYAGMGEESMEIYKIGDTKATLQHTFTVEFSTEHQMEYLGLDEIPDVYDSQYYIYYDGTNYDNGYLENNIVSYDTFKSKLSKYEIYDATINSTDSYPSGGYDSKTNLSVVMYEYMYPLNQTNLDNYLQIYNTTTTTKNNKSTDVFSDVISKYKKDSSASYSLCDLDFDGKLELVILHGESEAVKYYELYNSDASYIGQISAMHATLYFDKYCIYTSATFAGDSPTQSIYDYYIDNLTGEMLLDRDIPNEFYNKYGYYDLNNEYYKVNFKDISKYSYAEVKPTSPTGGMSLDDYIMLLADFDKSSTSTTTKTTTTTTTTTTAYAYQTFTDDTDINDIINTIVKNKSTWFYDSLEKDTKVTFLDIDFDGDLEFIVADNQGSGYYTYTDYYKVTKDSISKMSVNADSSEDYSILPDILGDDFIKLYSIDDVLKYTATDIEKYDSSENNEKRVEFYFDSTSNSISINMDYMVEKLSSGTLYYDSNFNQISESSYNSLKESFSSTHGDSNDLNLKYKWVSIPDDNTTLGQNLLEAYNAFAYDKLLDPEDTSILPDDELYTDGDYQYIVLNGYAIIGKYTGSDKNVSIPETLGGYTVVAIGGIQSPENDYMLEGAFESNNDIVSVTMPNTIQHIADYAFFCCYKLEQVTFSTRLQSIGYDSFNSCKSLTSIDLSNTGVTKIMGEAFGNCEQLSNVQLPEILEQIYQDAFIECPNLTSITIPKSVTMAGIKSFGFVNNQIVDGFKMYIHYFSPYYNYCNENNIDYEWIYDNYEEYFTGVHYYFANKSNKYIYEDYSFNNNMIYQNIYNIMQWDIQNGSLSTSYTLSAINDFIHFDFKSFIDDCKKYSDIDNLTEDDIYTIVLAQFLLDSNDEEILFKYQQNFLLDLFEECQDQLGIGLDGSDIIQFINDINDAEDIKSLKQVLNELPKEFNKTGFKVSAISSIIIQPILQYSEDFSEIVYVNSVYYAIKELFNDDYEIIKQIKIVADDYEIDGLTNACIRMLNVLKSDNVNSLVNKFISEDNNEAVSNAVSTVVSNTFSTIACTIVSSLGLPGMIYSISSAIISISSAFYDKLNKTDEVEFNMGYFLVCGQVHKILYEILSENAQISPEEYTFSDAVNYHTLITYYKRIDLIAYEYASNYLTLFIENNMSIKSALGIAGGSLIKPINIIQNSEQYFALAMSLGYLDDTIYECFDDILNYYQSWLDCYVKKISGDQLQCCDDNVQLTFDTKNWSMDNNEVQQIIINCPVDVEVYDPNGELIATLSDDGVQSELSYRHYFMVLDEIDENENTLSSKSKVLLLPEGYTYKLVATDNGSMCIYNQLIDYSNEDDSSEFVYSFEDIPLSQGYNFEVSQGTSGYVLTNTTTGKMYNNSYATVNKSILHSKEIMLVVVVIVLTIIMIIIVVLITNNKKNKGNKRS